MNTIKENINNGVIIVEPNENDYIAGAASPLPIINLTNGDNRPYKPDEENQGGSGGDKMDCVTVSGSGAIETDLNILIVTGKMPIGHLAWLNKWGFIAADGKVRTSTRWASIQNGTTMQGNSANGVAEWFRKNGFIPESMLPNDQTMEWRDYYNTACITDEMKKCAAESLIMFSMNYEWVVGDDKDLTDHLKRGAIQILTAVCPGWTAVSPVPACNLPIQHATELLCVESPKKDIFDSYDPHNKTLGAGYPIPYRMLYLIQPIINNILMAIIKKQGEGTLYAQAGDLLVPFETDFPTYQVDFANAKIIELSPTEFAKFKIASAVALTKKI